MGEDGDIDTWRLDRLTDEPIYCAVPTPTNPDDIICYGSDEELDDAAKVAKRLRYEEQGLKYLNGQPLRLFSATLRGPFDKASGWRNPWLPQAPNRFQSDKEVSKDTPAIKKSFLRELKLRAAAENSTSGTDHSMQCHLPSPESNRGLEVSHEYLDSEKHGRIKDWARGISIEALERDQFWAPEKTMDEGNEDKPRKRHAAEEWLRKKSTKRNRTNNTQGTGAASTPTPVPAPNPLMETVPTSTPDAQCHKQKATRKCPNRSFEMTTPSSTADQRSAKPINTQPFSTSVNNDTQSVDELATIDEATASLTSSAVSTTSRKPPTSESKMPAAIHVSETNSSETSSIHKPGQSEDNCDAPLEASPSEPKSGVEGSHEEIHGDESFESFIDQSFYYHARLPKQEIRREEHTNVQAEDSVPQITHPTGLETEDCSGDRESSSPAKEKSPLPTEMASDRDPRPQSAADNSSCAPNVNVEDHSIHNSDTKEYLTEKCVEENDVATSEVSKGDNVPCLASADPKTTQGEAISSTHPRITTIEQTCHPEMSPETYSPLKREHTSMKENLTACSPQPLPKKIRLEQFNGLQEADNYNKFGDIPQHRVDTEPAVGEGSTLVGDSMDVALAEDPMDVDEPSVAEPTRSPEPTYHTDPAARDTDTVSKVSHAGNGSSGSATNEIFKDEYERNIVSLSQLECGIVNSNQLPLSASTPNHAPSRTGATVVKAEPQGGKENIPVLSAQLDRSYSRQSPWTPNYIPSHEIEIKSEPIGADDEIHSFASINMYHSSPLKSHQESAIRASQQSPWARATPLPTMATARECEFDLADIESVYERIKEIQNEHGLCDDEENIRTATAATNGASILPISANNSAEKITGDTEPQFHRSEQWGLGAKVPEPSTPEVPEARTSTPEPEISIKSFAKFNTPSPVRHRSRLTKYRGLSTGRRSGILVATPSNPWSSSATTKSSNNRRVSFAPLPGDEDARSPPVVAAAVARPASPPPETMIEAGDEDVNDTFHNHFDAVKQRSRRGGDPPRLRIQPRLLPSSSQQKPESPNIGAMAAAFQEADALLQKNILSSSAKDIGNDFRGLDPVSGEELAGAADGVATLQSPWRTQSQQPLLQVDNDDAVAAVLGNLDQFLDAWDVDSAMRRASFGHHEEPAAPGPKNQGQDQHQIAAGTEMVAVDVLRGVGVWD